MLAELINYKWVAVLDSQLIHIADLQQFCAG